MCTKSLKQKSINRWPICANFSKCLHFYRILCFIRLLISAQFVPTVFHPQYCYLPNLTKHIQYG
jgi:hypothetical protein